MYVLNILILTKKKKIGLKESIFENCYKRIGFTKENSYYSLKYQKNKYLYCLQLN